MGIIFFLLVGFTLIATIAIIAFSAMQLYKSHKNSLNEGKNSTPELPLFISGIVFLVSSCIIPDLTAYYIILTVLLSVAIGFVMTYFFHNHKLLLYNTACIIIISLGILNKLSPTQLVWTNSQYILIIVSSLLVFFIFTKKIRYFMIMLPAIFGLIITSSLLNKHPILAFAIILTLDALSTILLYRYLKNDKDKKQKLFLFISINISLVCFFSHLFLWFIPILLLPVLTVPVLLHLFRNNKLLFYTVIWIAIFYIIIMGLIYTGNTTTLPLCWVTTITLLGFLISIRKATYFIAMIPIFMGLISTTVFDYYRESQENTYSYTTTSTTFEEEQTSEQRAESFEEIETPTAQATTSEPIIEGTEVENTSLHDESPDHPAPKLPNDENVLHSQLFSENYQKGNTMQAFIILHMNDKFNLYFEIICENKDGSKPQMINDNMVLACSDGEVLVFRKGDIFKEEFRTKCSYLLPIANAISSVHGIEDPAERYQRLSTKNIVRFATYDKENLVGNVIVNISEPTADFVKNFILTSAFMYKESQKK